MKIKLPVRTVRLTSILMAALTGLVIAAPAAHADVDAYAPGSHFILFNNKNHVLWEYHIEWTDLNDTSRVYHVWDGTISPFGGQMRAAWSGGEANDRVDIWLNKDLATLGDGEIRKNFDGGHGIQQGVGHHYSILGNENLCLLDRFTIPLTDYHSTADAGGDGECTAN